ncbi:cell wall hydrolase [Halalkalibacter kiskunsagensis]|uniref:Cell wall hydrolase n=1 Tax=Halalkalibacter kiskunsagensis TaxID=1548599 RepID=A0ABV6KJI4_9BACI
MHLFSHYTVKKRNTGYEIHLYLDPMEEEYSEAFGRLKDKDKKTIEQEASHYIKGKLPEIKGGLVKVMSGAIVVTTLVLGAEAPHTKAAEIDKTDEEEVNTNSVAEEVLLDISTRNELESDALKELEQIKGEKESITIPERSNEEINMVEAEFVWLAKMIHCEAKGESLEGQIAVGAVILNRVKSDQFPSTVEEVILEKTSGTYQFSPAGSGAIYSAKPDANSIEAAKRALEGEDPTNGSLYFYNPDKTGDQWIRTRTVSTVIDNHVFAY